MRTKRARGWRPLTAFVAAALCAIAGGGATAAMLDGLFPEGVPGYDAAPGVTVRSRLRPEEESLGIRLDSFIVRPLLQRSLGYDSNVLGGRPARGSWMVRNQPSILFGSDWSRSALGGYLAADDRRYLDQPSQNRTDGTLSLGGALDVGRDRLSVAVAHITQHEDRDHIDALPSDRPIAFRLDDARMAYAANFGRWTLTPSAEVSRWRYDATTILGLPASQAYRNRDVLEGGTTLRYELAPLRNVLLVARAIGQSYPDTPVGALSQNSTGYQLLAGIDYDDDAVWRYRLLLGAETRQFAAYPTRTAPIAESEITWMPTGLTTVRARLARSMEDASQEGVSGFTYTTAKLTIDHEYLRDLLLSASVGLQHAAFLQGGSQAGYAFGFGATWLVNRMVQVSATYDLAGYGGGHAAGRPESQPTARSLAMLMLRLGL